MRTVEMFEVSFHHHAILFSNAVDAQAAAGALCRGAYQSAACNPLHPERKIDLAPIESSVRRVFIPVSDRKCVGAFGRKLKPATKRLELSHEQSDVIAVL